MFNSVKYGLAALEKNTGLFEHADSEVIDVALASLPFHLIRADNHENDSEVNQFKPIMAEAFTLSEQRIISLYDHLKNVELSLYDYFQHIKNDLRSNLVTVNEYLKYTPNLRITFMSTVNQLIQLNGGDNEEIYILHEAIQVVFPEIAKNIIDRK